MMYQAGRDGGVQGGVLQSNSSRPTREPAPRHRTDRQPHRELRSHGSSATRFVVAAVVAVFVGSRLAPGSPAKKPEQAEGRPRRSAGQWLEQVPRRRDAVADQAALVEDQNAVPYTKPSPRRNTVRVRLKL